MTTMSNPLQAQALATMLSDSNGTPAAGGYNPVMSNAAGANNAIMPLINALAQRRMQQMFDQKQQQQNGQPIAPAAAPGAAIPAAAPNLVPGGAGVMPLSQVPGPAPQITTGGQ